MSKKLKSSDVLKSDFGLKVEKQHSHLRFMLTVLIHMTVHLSLLCKVKKSAYLTPITFLLISEDVWKTKT